ncbi:hypothetical protein [Ralstonia solanacearum]|uniref:hypothetical protein n=1 Tax=Ralstonia solanacearum TaxID=305 RepID=UPI003D8003E6
MKERPILFSGAMVRAILDGRKTQTRRIMKNQPPADTFRMDTFHHPKGQHYFWAYKEAFSGCELHPGWEPICCPYGQPCDLLWVRESFWGCDAPGHGDQPCVVYDDEWHGKDYYPTEIRPWARKFGRIPSIHMPRDCSRITLEITSVRVERLQDCSEEDARAEGCEAIGATYRRDTNGNVRSLESLGGPYRDGYRVLWEQINGPGSWEANPWVWVVEFKRI